MVQGMTLIFLFGFPHPLLCDMAEPVMDISGLGTKARYSCKNGFVQIVVQIGTWICVCNSHNENGTHLELIPFDCFIIFFPIVPEVLQLIYTLIQYKGYTSKFKFFDGVQFRKYFISLPAFYLIIWLMKSPKNFEKTSILKIWQLIFFRAVKTQFGEISLKSCIFRQDKNWFSPILPHYIYFSD